MKRAALYVRVSTTEQEKGFSLQAQEDKLRKYTAQHHLEVVKVYKDNTSGMDTERESINQLLDDLENNSFDTVLITERDRISRNPSFAGYIKFGIKRAGKELIAINEPQTKTEYDELIEGVVELFASFETRRRLRRIVRGKEKAKAEARVLYKVPFGYDSTKPYPVPNKDAEIIKKIFKERANGNGVRETAKKYGFKHPGTVTKILKNKFYAGYVKIDGKWTKGNHTPIISEELFERVRRL